MDNKPICVRYVAKIHIYYLVYFSHQISGKDKTNILF